MSDLTPAFDGLLKQHEAPPTRGSFDIAQIDEFLKEAYKIVRISHLLKTFVASLLF
jgi:syntaxin 18